MSYTDMMRRSESIREFMNWFIDAMEEKRSNEAYEELLRIGYGLEWLDEKGWLNKKGRDISRSYYNRIVDARDLSRLGLIAVCVGIVEEEWYCYKPALRGFEEKDRGYVYIIIDDASYRLHQDGTILRFKVGFSKNPKTRLKSIRTSNPSSRLFYHIQALKQTEKYIHDTFSEVFVRIGKSEWFEAHGYQDWELRDFESTIKAWFYKASDAFFAEVSGTSDIRYPDYESIKENNAELSGFIRTIRHHETQRHAGTVRRMQDVLYNDLPDLKKLDGYGKFVCSSYLEYIDKDVPPPYRLLGEAYAVAYSGWHAR